MGKYSEMIYDYQKRQGMRNHPVFKKIEQQIHLEISQTGCLKYLLWQAHANITRDNANAVVRFGDWIKYYFGSGQKRKAEEQSLQSDKYLGRTEEELEEIAQEVIQKAAVIGYNITPQAAANTVYILVIDKVYETYMRCCNIIFQLRRRYPNMEFSLSTPQIMESYDVDIICKEKSVVNGITVLPAEEINNNVEPSFRQQHSIFEMIMGCGVKFVYAAVNGKVAGTFPEFDVLPNSVEINPP